jgi:hypothetical protein
MPSENVIPRLLVKVRPSAIQRIAESKVNLEPLLVNRRSEPAFGISSEPQWFAVELPEPAETPWDLAHARVADQLGIDGSDLVFAEPDMVHDIYLDNNEAPIDGFGVTDNCSTATGQDGSHGKKIGEPPFPWHLSNQHTQLKNARTSVQFSNPKTRIAHLDTGYLRSHACKPGTIVSSLERTFVDGDANPGSSEDPDNWKFLIDNSGHGTGTIGILAGGPSIDLGNEILGGAPDAEILPLRIADRVVLLRTRAFAEALTYATNNNCDVVTMSMGGLPSSLWSEVVDDAYLRGVCVVAAAGNNFNGLPTRNLVYPARYDRVIAVCGAMADDTPYTKLDAMEGNFGPDSRMGSAIAAYTPNIPWPEYPCETKVRFNGEGTSAATPQVAAAAALWFEKYKQQLPRDWRRVEAVRNALFSTAKSKAMKKQFGNGILQAVKALNVQPVLTLPQTKHNSDTFAFFRVITGLGIAEPTVRERMFNLELLQLWCVTSELQELIPDPEADLKVKEDVTKQVIQFLIENEKVSLRLRRHLVERYAAIVGQRPRRTPGTAAVIPNEVPACDRQGTVDDPPHRRLRVYSLDPSFSNRFDTVSVNRATLSVRWEQFEKPGMGEYLEIQDTDPAGGKYDAVDLDDTRLVAQDGHEPSEGNPQFHQQMVYAVAMKTIEHFEESLGRPVLWRSGSTEARPNIDSEFTRRLRIHPHAVYQANAFYSPSEVALKFGYFEAGETDIGDFMPGSRIYTCLSHDIIAHETTHAVLDGMHRRFSEPSNPDVLALHEGFADIVALMQHFTIPEVLVAEIAKTRGNIEGESFLGSLAIQFGKAMGQRGALRNAIGTIENGVWKRLVPDPLELSRRLTPHSRGAILVAAVFDAFIAIYNARISDLLRIYTQGTGVLESGAIHPDLVGRLADEASKSARHVLNMCIRALDYLPPVDVTFFEYLRGLITADFDLVPDDKHNYRVAFVEAFRRRGIYPSSLTDPSEGRMRTVSVDTVRWESPDASQFKRGQAGIIFGLYEEIIESLKEYANACLYFVDRQQLFDETRQFRRRLHEQFKEAFREHPVFARELGLDPDPKTKFEVHEIRRSSKISPNGFYVPQMVVSLTQSKRIRRDAAEGIPEYRFRGGSTLIVDLPTSTIKYRIVKNIESIQRRQATARFRKYVDDDALRSLFMSRMSDEPFAVLHTLHDDND